MHAHNIRVAWGEFDQYSSLDWHPWAVFDVKSPKGCPLLGYSSREVNLSEQGLQGVLCEHYYSMSLKVVRQLLGGMNKG